MNKLHALHQLAEKRRRIRLNGHHSLGDFHEGYYECDFASPWTISAQNVDADLMIFGQDWVSSNILAGDKNPDLRREGQISTLETNKNLRRFLTEFFELDLSETFSTNVFVFIKSGNMSATIPTSDMTISAREFAIPQIDIVRPRMVLCLGKRAFDSLIRAADLSPHPWEDAGKTASPISIAGAEVYGLPHPGRLGIINAGGLEVVAKQWAALGDRFKAIREGKQC